MRLSKFLIMMGMVTLFSLLYVYQQSEIFRLAYAGQKRLTNCDDLLDKNTSLKYNIARNVSLTRIGNKISADHGFQMPDAYRLVKLEYPLNSRKLKRNIQKKEPLISRLFGVKRQAEAGVINL